MKTLMKKLILFTLIAISLQLKIYSIPQEDLINTIKQSAREKARTEFLSNNLTVFDGIAGTNCCHLNALKITLLAKNEEFKRALRDNQPEMQSDERLNYLANAMLINSTLPRTNKERTNTLITLLDLQQHPNIGQLKRILQRGSFIQNVKKELNDSILDFFDKNLTNNFEQFQSEFPKSNENLLIIPKFLGFTEFLKYLKLHGNIWMFLKCSTSSGIVVKFITPDQQQFISCEQACNQFNISSLEPVIVIESNSDLNAEEFNSFLQTIKPEKLELAVASEFNKCNQANCLELVRRINPKIDNWLQFAEQRNITETHPSKFFIQHMLPDTFAHAIGRNGE